MNKTVAICVAVLALAPAAFAQQNKENFKDKYGALSARNMFLRERHAPRPINTTPRVPRIRDDPQTISRAFVLRGVTIEDDELHAYLENARNGNVARVAPGDSLSGGRVTEIAIDAIAYEVDGKTTWIEIGQSLSGARDLKVVAVPPVSPSTGPSNESAAPSTLPPGGGSMEERLKARRALQKGAAK